MLQDMRILARNYLKEELDPDGDDADLEAWYQRVQAEQKNRLFPYLVESGERVPSVYIIEQAEPGVMRMTIQEVSAGEGSGGGCPASLLPFIKPTGSRSSSVGPVLKRTFSRDKGPGPSPKVLNTTMQSFVRLAESDEPFGAYFREIVEVLQNPRLRLPDGSEMSWQEGYDCALAAAVDGIRGESQTVFLTVRALSGMLPGADARYVHYLFNEILAGDRYTTGSTPPVPSAICSLCGEDSVVVYSNGMKGAGINLLNADREGSFSALSLDNAWKRYAICAPCADLLFVFKAHVLKKHGNIVPFTAHVAGGLALVLPQLTPNLPQGSGTLLWETIEQYLRDLSSEVHDSEDNLLDVLKDVPGIVSFSIVWATFGQNFEEIVGSLQHVLPSRLRELSEFNEEFRFWSHPLFPAPLAKGHDLRPQLNLDLVHQLFYRPGPHSKALNQSANLRRLKQLLAEAVYHQSPMNMTRFHEEWWVTARAYWDEVLQEDKGYLRLLGAWDGPKRHQMSAARWIQRCAQFIDYLQQPKVGVFTMAERYYEPSMPVLKPYFGRESGIDTQEKAFAFVLGILYGKVLEIQGARGVNVSANALTWLKRLTLKGADLPELYTKIREKLINYEAEGNAEIRELIAEVGAIAVNLGDRIVLDGILTSYYLLLGQSMTTKVLPSKSKKDKGDN